MKTLFTTLVALVLLSCVGCATKPTTAPQWVDPNTLRQGPIVHTKLSDQQVVRIARLHKLFADVDPTPLEKWQEDFQRDSNPDHEIKIWEGMAEPYATFLQRHQPTLQGKKDAFQIVLLRSGSSAEETLSHMKLQVLTPADAREILALYHEALEPIRVYQK